MPIKLIPPRPGKTPYYYIRGTHKNVYVDETTGFTDKEKANKVRKKRIEAIERGDVAEPGVDFGPTFEDAALGYIEAGGEPRFLGSYDDDRRAWGPGLIRYFLDTRLSDIDQRAIDRAAVELYPTATPATRNRQVYTPMSAILKHAGVERSIRRPKGALGKMRVDWLSQEQAFRFIEAAATGGAIGKGKDKTVVKPDPEFAVFLAFLLYTGCRLSDALCLTCDRVTLNEEFAYFPKTKNDDPRAVHLPPFLVGMMASHPRGLDRQDRRVFRFRKCGALYTKFRNVRELAGPDVSFASFHTFCHTWATWMRRYAQLDTRGLVGTGRWRDQKSAGRYEHVVVTEEARKANLLPTPVKHPFGAVHGFSTDSAAGFSLRSPDNAEQKHRNSKG